MSRKKREADDDEGDELPWNEEQWEEFMKKSDARSAKYGELFETFMDHPDRDAIIDHEMGWDQPIEGEDDDDETGFDAAEMLENAEPMDEKEWREIRRKDEAALRAIPAYTRGFQFGLKVNRLLKKLMKETDGEDEDGIEAVSNGFLIAAKIAGAHGMGYDDDVLCGNIVNCKRSLAAANECLAALERLKERKVLPAPKLDAAIKEAREIRGLVEQHIAELRSRVWWQ